MARKSGTNGIKQSTPLASNEPVIPTQVLLKTRAFAKYQRDFAKALLPATEYTPSEAKRILDNYFNI